MKKVELKKQYFELKKQEGQIVAQLHREGTKELRDRVNEIRREMRKAEKAYFKK